MIKAYYAKVTEFESGWDCRPDGYLVTFYKDPRSFENFSKCIVCLTEKVVEN